MLNTRLFFASSPVRMSSDIPLFIGGGRLSLKLLFLGEGVWGEAIAKGVFDYIIFQCNRAAAVQASVPDAFDFVLPAGNFTGAARWRHGGRRSFASLRFILLIRRYLLGESLSGCSEEKSLN